MASPKTTIWPLDPHTRAKHEILHRYLQAWTPILSLGGFPRVLYIDGFAGPGRYSQGEDGSPIIALRAALDQKDRIKAKVEFLFIEREPDRARALKDIVVSMPLPSNFTVQIVGGKSFEEASNELLASYVAEAKPLPPTFAFIDPFGWNGLPFSIVKSILSYPSCEVLVNFMYEEINRFVGHPDQVTNFDAFFGTSGWRDCVNIKDPRTRNRCLHDLYFRQLREAAGVKYVRSFEMRNEKDVVDYYLFYATKNLKGLKKMKEAMWKVDESGEFRFSDATDPNQLLLFEKAPNYPVLRREILARFAGREASIGEIEEYVLAETAFRETHYKREILKQMELASPPQLEVIDPPSGRRRGTYPVHSLRLRFLSGAK